MRDAKVETCEFEAPNGLFSRRNLLALGAGLGAVAAFGKPAAAAPSIVPMPSGQFPSGTIVISLRQRRLYLATDERRAISYPVAVGMSGRAWSGWARIDGKHINPAWVPPAVVRAAVRGLPAIIPGGAPNNPMGPRALTLDRHEIAIHGTTRSMRRSIGTAASFGCIRMYNEDIVDLFDRVSVGTPVVAI
jgi:lipoprotein-anchoring transpeptidase ErfK/SrfK